MIHCGTNNLNSDDTPEKIANVNIQLGKVAKMEKNDVVVSEICPHRDRFNQKANDVNQLLAGKCFEQF